MSALSVYISPTGKISKPSPKFSVDQFYERRTLLSSARRAKTYVLGSSPFPSDSPSPSPSPCVDDNSEAVLFGISATDDKSACEVLVEMAQV